MCFVYIFLLPMFPQPPPSPIYLHICSSCPLGNHCGSWPNSES
ncbi:unnamed protein product [Gulo gulo]|uniref:Uncharacterized protein n=1 Tax=Gulo gulo TaxID=48420 RepID=A0A9X9MDW9_GULGU|nr:unnamed protein product [Gulo gulo]